MTRIPALLDTVHHGRRAVVPLSLAVVTGGALDILARLYPFPAALRVVLGAPVALLVFLSAPAVVDALIARRSLRRLVPSWFR